MLPELDAFQVSFVLTPKDYSVLTPPQSSKDSKQALERSPPLGIARGDALRTNLAGPYG